MGFEDETWWSRLARPALHAWTDSGQSPRLVEQLVAKGDPDPKALACYGVLVSWAQADEQPLEEVWLRFVDGRPISVVTTKFLEWTCDKLEGLRKRVLALIWDNASWHKSHKVSLWLREHNRRVKREGKGVRIIACPLPTKSPWLNPMEPHWVHGKRNVVEANGLLSSQELADRVCAHFHCDHDAHLTIPEKVT